MAVDDADKRTRNELVSEDDEKPIKINRRGWSVNERKLIDKTQLDDRRVYTKLRKATKRVAGARGHRRGVVFHMHSHNIQKHNK